MVSILVSQCNSKERFNRLTAITWVHEFINLGQCVRVCMWVGGWAQLSYGRACAHTHTTLLCIHAQ